MILCINIGNTHILGGVFEKEKLQFEFRLSSHADIKPDTFATFLKNVFEENELQLKAIKKIVISSQVPALDPILTAVLSVQFGLTPYFLTGNAVSHLLKIAYQNKDEVGADRLSVSIAGKFLYPQKNLIIIDLGTATTFNVISKQGEFLGGLIMPGMYLAMEALAKHTAKLPAIEITKPKALIGTTTISNIEAGIYYEHLGAMREIIQRITETAFKSEEPLVIGTGGFARLFEDEKIFHLIEPSLVLKGLYFFGKEL